MPKLIKYRELIADGWTLIKETDIDPEHLQQGFWILPFPEYKRFADEGRDVARFGFWLNNDAVLEEVKPFIRNVQVIAIEFPTFTDGRGFSLARALRDRYDYSGELRAFGYYLPDQLFYMNRCGFDAFSLRDDVSDDEVAEMIGRFNDFSETYQAAVDDPQPLFRKRA